LSQLKAYYRSLLASPYLQQLRLERVAAACVLALSVIALAWGVYGIREPLPVPFLYPMRHTTALCTGMLAISLIASIRSELKLARYSALVATLVAVAALATQIYRWNLEGVSAINPAPYIAGFIHTAFPNALCFLITGSAMMLLSGTRPSVHRPAFAAIAGALTATLGFCGLCNEIWRFIPANPAFEGEVSIDATASLFLLGCVMVRLAYVKASAAADKLGEDVEVHREMHRPVLVAVLGTLAAFVLWRSLLQERSNVVAFQSQSTARAASRALRAELNRRLSEVEYGAESTTVPFPLKVGLQKGAEIQWTDSHKVMSERNSEDRELRKLLERYSGRSAPFYALLREKSKTLQIVLAAPLNSSSTRIALLDLKDLIDAAAVNVVGPNFQMFLLDGGATLYEFPSSRYQSETGGRAETALPELSATLRIQPRSDFVRRGASWASHMVLAIGLNASFLLALSAYLLHVARTRLEEVQEIRSGLEREVDQRRSAELALARKAKQLESSNADLREFAYVTSHDLQEPLRSVNGFAQLLSRRYKGRLDEDADEFLDYITDASTRMTAMIQGLLAYSRVMHAADLDERVPLTEAVDWAKSNLLLAIEEANAEIKVGELPVLHGNRVQFGQLMQNLIGNAIKYRGADPPVVEIRCESHDSEHVITIADNGAGIGPEFQERIFGLFKRAHGKNYPGAGVGLALCKKIVERHGGRIWVESKVGQGSEFRFTAPRVYDSPLI
jgi:signal transduction histidine kinase